MLEIKKNGEKKAEVYCFLENPIKDKKEFVIKIINQISFREDIGFAGYKDKKSLTKWLTWSIYGSRSAERWNSVDVDRCMVEIESVLEKCSVVIKDQIIKIFLFPTVDEFVIDKMEGVSGFTPWKNTILLGVFHTERWKKALQETLGHELAHALAINFNNRETIGDDLVSEGVAEHFREAFLGGEKASWVKSISKEKCKDILLEIKRELNIKNDKLYRELFFGTGKYPRWSGYAIGYYIVESFLDKVDKSDWIRIIKTPSSEILKNSYFLNMCFIL